MSYTQEQVDKLREEIGELAATEAAVRDLVAEAEQQATLKIEFERLERERQRVETELAYAVAQAKAAGVTDPRVNGVPEAPPAPDVAPAINANVAPPVEDAPKTGKAAKAATGEEK